MKLRYRRIVASSLLGVLLHVFVVGNAYACGPNSLGDSAESMPGMLMANTSMTGSMSMDVENGATAAPSSDQRGHDQKGCQLPSALDDCQSMAACAPAILTSAHYVFTSAITPYQMPVLDRIADSSLVPAPDFRPPRA
jgi:hypothetical protein